MTLTLFQTDYIALLPFILVFLTALLILLLETFAPTKKRLINTIQIVGLVAALSSACTFPVSTNPLLTPWLHFDGFAHFFSIFFLSIALFITAISAPFFTQFGANRSEFYFFLLASVFGLMLIASANDYLTLFLGLETLSIALYVLCGYMKTWAISHEAAFKYFLLGSISTSFLLLGIAMIYGATGTSSLSSMPLAKNWHLFLSGISLVTLSLLFKAAVVPFHVWAPDVYAGAPTPVTAFMAVGTKVGAFSALIRIFLLTLPQFDVKWHELISYAAIVTLIFANFVAMKQVDLRRFFAYSGISHAGFLLIPLAAGGPDAAPSMLFYLVVYSLATLGSFAIISFLDIKSDGVSIYDLKGLWQRSGLLTCIFTLALLTLAGIPPTIGFFAKFYLLKVGYLAGYYGLVVVGLLTTILAAFYYLRIVITMFSKEVAVDTKPLRSTPALVAALASFVALFLLSFYPEPFLQRVINTLKG